MVGAQLEGFDTMVSLSNDAKIAVIEGDEYLSSPIDRRPKFHLYKPNIAVLSGIAWDHINVFPTFENYVEQFKIFIDLIEPNGHLIYCTEDEELNAISQHAKVSKHPYSYPAYEIIDGETFIKNGNEKIKLQVFGKHNLMNLQAAKNVCNLLGVSDNDFYKSIASFTGASKRLELVKKNENTVFYKDFAHSPSKLKATTAAVKEQFPARKLIACMELHTFSSLNDNFLNEYNGAMQNADEAYVYFNPHVIEHKKLKPITEEQVLKAFGSNNIKIFTDAAVLTNKLKSIDWSGKVLLMMSSGNFDGIDFKKFADDLF